MSDDCDDDDGELHDENPLCPKSWTFQRSREIQLIAQNDASPKNLQDCLAHSQVKVACLAYAKRRFHRLLQESRSHICHDTWWPEQLRDSVSEDTLFFIAHVRSHESLAIHFDPYENPSCHAHGC
jgi:hypothetical protein